MFFISYSRSDISDVRRLLAGLERRGLDYWIDESNIPVGAAFVRRLGDAMQAATDFLLVDTMASRDSYWVYREILAASRNRTSGKYRSIIRVFAPECRENSMIDWDAAFLWDLDFHERISSWVDSQRQHSALRCEVGIAGFGVEIEGNYSGDLNNWVGRQEELRSLDRWWFSEKSGMWIVGLGGAGKSGLIQTWLAALKYIGYEYTSNVRVLFVHGRALDDLIVLRQRLSAIGGGREALLLIVDSHDEAPVEANLPELLELALEKSVKVLVSSRLVDPVVLPEEFVTLPLATLSNRESIALLEAAGVSDLKEEIAFQLSGHPLALVIFSRYLAEGKQSAATALDRLRQSATSLKEDNVYRASSALSDIIARTLDFISPAAKLLAQCLSRPESSNTEWRSLVPASMSSLEAEGALLELASMGMVQLDDFANPRQVLIHPLVRALIRGKTESERTCKD
jgi:TIR domain